MFLYYIWLFKLNIQFLVLAALLAVVAADSAYPAPAYPKASYPAAGYNHKSYDYVSSFIMFLIIM